MVHYAPAFTRVPAKAHSSGGILLCVHGITSSRDEWGIFKTLSLAAEQIGIASFRFDYRCHGVSSLPFTEFSLHGVLSDIEAAWAAASTHAETSSVFSSVPLFVCGSSFGGGLVYRWASTSAKVRYAFLLAPVFDYWSDITKTAQSWKTDLLTDGTIDYVGKRLSRTIIHEARYFKTVDLQGAVLVPGMIFHGTADEDVPIEMSRAVTCRHPHFQLHPIQGAGHVLAVPGDLDMVDPKSWGFVDEAHHLILKTMHDFVER